MQRLTIALDAMGGDSGPPVVIPALQRSLQQYPEVDFHLVGEQALLTPLLMQYNLYEHPRIRLIHTSDVIHNEDKTLQVLRQRRQSSMAKALELVEQQQAQACVSAGQTGALVALSHCILKPISGIERPALVTRLPTKNGQQTLLLDLGANIDCNANLLLQFAIMGAVLVEQLAHIQSPKIALLNIGSESIKGNDTIRHASHLLRKSDFLNYQGFIEGNQLFDGLSDIIVCDGFSGNVALKTAEGVADFILQDIRKAFGKNKFKGWLVRQFFPHVDAHLSGLKPNQYNGASLLGLQGCVVKSHGGADSEAFYQAICEAIEQSALNIPSVIGEKIQKYLSMI